MRRLVFIIIGVFAVFTMIRAYAGPDRPEPAELTETVQSAAVSDE